MARALPLVVLLVACATPARRGPAVMMPRRCAWQLGIVRASLGVSSARASQLAVDELDRLGAAYDEVRKSAAPAEVAACRREVEPLIGSVAIVWGREPHRHGYAQWAEQVLSLHATLFPDSPSRGEIAYERGLVIVGLAACGCDGHKDEPARWREAAASFAVARASGQQVDVRWENERLPLAEAARRGEAMAQARAQAASAAP